MSCFLACVRAVRLTPEMLVSSRDGTTPDRVTVVVPRRGLYERVAAKMAEGQACWACGRGRGRVRVSGRVLLSSMLQSGLGSRAVTEGLP